MTTPLRALFDTEKIQKSGFCHDGRFATLEDVVGHYDRHAGESQADRGEIRSSSA